MCNYPENLQGTEIYENMETAVDTMEDAVSNIEKSSAVQVLDCTFCIYREIKRRRWNE